jgi:hypothetical protein
VSYHGKITSFANKTTFAIHCNRLERTGRQVINPTARDREMLSAVFAKVDVPALAVTVGLMCALGLFLATAMLLVQDAPAHYPVGPHLGALADYLPAYRVSWAGALIGAFYGFLVGAVIGFFVAVYWNLTHYLAMGIMLIRSARLAD